MRNAECRLRALNSVTSLFIYALAESTKEEMKLEARILKSAFRNFSAYRRLTKLHNFQLLHLHRK